MADLPFRVPDWTPPEHQLPRPDIAPDDHPYPWYSDCRYCGALIGYHPPKKQFWEHTTGPYSTTLECPKAPRRSDGSRGLHAPQNVLSRNSKHLGPVPVQLLPVFEAYG